MALGIENLKKVVGTLITLAQTAETSLADGFQTSDLFAFIPVLSGIPDLLKNKDAIVQEFKDLTADETKELVDYVEQNFTIANKKVEDIIVAALDAGVSLFILVEKIKGTPAA